MTVLTASDKAAHYTFKVGDIVYTQNGGPTFYRVTKRTECFVTLQRLEPETVEYTDGGYGQSGRRVPLNIDDNAPCLTPTPRTKIKRDDDCNEKAFIDNN